MKNIKVKVNGQEIITAAGKTILEMVNEHKLDEIPTLCHDPRLAPYGSCYLCVVEVKGVNRLVPACCSPVSEGMEITTNSDKIKEARKTALSLLLSNHYADCIAPCKNTCPAGVDVQGYIALTSMGKFNEAVKLIKKTNPLPLVCGRVCVRECELSCRRNRVDEPVGIDYLKRYCSDIDIENPWVPQVPERNGKKVAVVGGGPSGLTCSYFLTLKGYSVTIFEELPELGGMLRYGIPEYRLPKKVLEREIKWITDLGIEVKKNISIGNDISLDSLHGEGYNAVYLAMGAQKANKMQVPDEETTEGVIPGVDFLRDIGLKKEINIYGKVVVVGGGNTAIDAARTSLRYGAEKVTILYRRTRKEMPANNMEIEAAIHEGVEMIFLSAPVKIIKENRRLKGLECIRMELGEPDKSGRRRPVPVEGSEYILDCDFAVSAIGQAINLKGFTGDKRLNITRWGSIDYNKNTFETSLPGVFTGGDVATGPSVAIEAIAHGRFAAQSIDEYIMTGRVEPKKKDFNSFKDTYGEIPQGEFQEYSKIKRETMAELNPKERIKTFEEVELGYTPNQALNETSRCLECGCSYAFECKLKQYATLYDIDLTKYMGEVRKYKIDHNHPFIVLDPNKCILCGRCVRTCTEVINAAAFGFVARGFKSVVKPSMEKELLKTTCISCGNCIYTCPTGAITEKLPFKKPGPWETEKSSSICSFCSVGCNLTFNIVADELFYPSNSSENTHNKGFLCSKGHFGSRYLTDENRIIAPKIRKDGELIESDWDEAISKSADSIKAILDKYGPDSIAVFASPKMTNEELYLIQKFARFGLKTNNIHSFTNLLNGNDMDSLSSSWGITTSTTNTDELDKADVIMIINSDLTSENLIMELKIRQAQKKGAKVVLLNSLKTRLGESSDLWVKTRKGANTLLLNGVMNELIKNDHMDKEFINNLTEGFEEFKKSLAGLNPEEVSRLSEVPEDKLIELIELIGNKKLNLIVVYNIDFQEEKSENDLKAIGNLLMLTGKIGKEGNGLIILRDNCNSTGLIDMGVIPDYLPGYVTHDNAEQVDSLSKYWGTELKKFFKPVKLLDKMLNKDIRGLIIFGENPLSQKENIKYFSDIEFLMTQDLFETETCNKSDVVFPLSTYIESGGSFTACDRRVQRFKKLLNPKSGLENWQFIIKLGEKLGIPFDFESIEDIFNEIKEANNLYNNVEIDQFWFRNLFEGRFPSSDGKGRFQIYSSEISTVKPEKSSYIASEDYYRSHIRQYL